MILGPLASATRPSMTFLSVASQVLAPAFFPRFVTSRSCLRLVLCRSELSTWHDGLLETPSFVQGTFTPSVHAHAGRTKAWPLVRCAERRQTLIRAGRSSTINPVANVSRPVTGGVGHANCWASSVPPFALTCEVTRVICPHHSPQGQTQTSYR